MITIIVGIIAYVAGVYSSDKVKEVYYKAKVKMMEWKSK